jgi:hypothetical protein
MHAYSTRMGMVLLLAGEYTPCGEVQRRGGVRRRARRRVRVLGPPSPKLPCHNIWQHTVIPPKAAESVVQTVARAAMVA